MLKNFKKYLPVFIDWLGRVINWIVGLFDDIEYFFVVYLFGGIFKFLIKYEFVRSTIGAYRWYMGLLQSSSRYRYYDSLFLNSFCMQIYKLIIGALILHYFSFICSNIHDDIPSVSNYPLLGSQQSYIMVEFCYYTILASIKDVYMFTSNVFFIHSDYDFFHSETFVTNRTFSYSKLFCRDSNIVIYLIENFLNAPAYLSIFFYNIVVDFIVLQPFLVVNLIFTALVYLYLMKEYFLIDMGMDPYVDLIRFEFDPELVLICRRDYKGGSGSDARVLNMISNLIYPKDVNFVYYYRPYMDDLSRLNYREFKFNHSIYYGDCLNFFTENCIISIPLRSFIIVVKDRVLEDEFELTFSDNSIIDVLYTKNYFSGNAILPFKLIFSLKDVRLLDYSSITPKFLLFLEKFKNLHYIHPLAYSYYLVLPIIKTLWNYI